MAESFRPHADSGRGEAAEKGPLRPGRRLAVDVLFATYLLVTAPLAAASGAWGGLLALLHVLFAGGALFLGRTPLPRTTVPRFLRAVYPVALTPLLYLELPVLNQIVVSGYFDATVQAWEALLFGGQVSVAAAARWPGLWVSEFLHLGYVSYYALVPIAAVAAFREGGAPAAHRLAFTTGLAFFVSYGIFCLFPVEGPRYLFSPLEGPAAEGSLFGAVHAILESGASRGTAFPSSHVAATTAAVLANWRESRAWFWLLVLPLAALVAGTVYGRFHYAVDAAAGLAVGAAAFLLAPRLVRWLGEWSPADPAGRPPPGEFGAGNPDAGPGVQRLA